MCEHLVRRRRRDSRHGSSWHSVHDAAAATATAKACVFWYPEGAGQARSALREAIVMNEATKPAIDAGHGDPDYRRLFDLNPHPMWIFDVQRSTSWTSMKLRHDTMVIRVTNFWS